MNNEESDEESFETIAKDEIFDRKLIIMDNGFYICYFFQIFLFI